MEGLSLPCWPVLNAVLLYLFEIKSSMVMCTYVAIVSSFCYIDLLKVCRQICVQVLFVMQ